MNKMKIISQIHDYEVVFADFEAVLLQEIKDGDIIIVDKVVLKINEKFFSKITNTIIPLQADEKQKSYFEVGAIIELLLNANFKKDKKIICIGGGTIQDSCSFVSLIFNRGVKWIYIPTTLLAQADSCIGGKLSINFKEKKNQIGGFYPPEKIIIDTKFISTLSQRDYFSGIGEMLHYFLLSEERELEIFKHNWNNKKNIQILIEESLLIKREFIEIDEFDEKERRILNYGHSFGHALESITNYKVPHGIAVCYGMDIANYTSFRLGFISYKTYLEMNEIIFDVIGKSGVFVEFKKIDIRKYMVFLQKDKKSTSSTIGLVLTKGIGNMFVEQKRYDEIFKIVEEYFNMPKLIK